MSDSPERSRKLGDSPLSKGGALDWIGEEEDAERESSETSEASGSPEEREEDASDSGGEGLRPGFRRHTLIMREDHIEKVDRLVTLEKLRSGGKLKKEVVAEIFEWYFKEHADSLSLDSVS